MRSRYLDGENDDPAVGDEIEKEAEGFILPGRVGVVDLMSHDRSRYLIEDQHVNPTTFDPFSLLIDDLPVSSQFKLPLLSVSRFLLLILFYSI